MERLDPRMFALVPCLKVHHWAESSPGASASPGWWPSSEWWTSSTPPSASFSGVRLERRRKWWEKQTALFRRRRWQFLVRRTVQAVGSFVYFISHGCVSPVKHSSALCVLWFLKVFVFPYKRSSLIPTVLPLEHAQHVFASPGIPIWPSCEGVLVSFMYKAIVGGDVESMRSLLSPRLQDNT